MQHASFLLTELRRNLDMWIKITILNAKFIILNAKFIILNAKFIILNTKFINFSTNRYHHPECVHLAKDPALTIILNTKFIIFITKFIILNTKFIILNTKFTCSRRAARAAAVAPPCSARPARASGYRSGRLRAASKSQLKSTPKLDQNQTKIVPGRGTVVLSAGLACILNAKSSVFPFKFIVFTIKYRHAAHLSAG